ncbi:hypothetical protein EUBDOL_01747 [Amedibacillus dolichus DSM 3991]|uniref:Uncharacterized protein n=1 Tax=Amedibacillus dolichus DSM 3991 TaxID=428127 RepID=A8REB8_9FIRM|nr:hypothetical protein EUBDOL_01747 [Amedibacillus dolichus DSM 3991]
MIFMLKNYVFLIFLYYISFLTILSYFMKESDNAM